MFRLHALHTCRRSCRYRKVMQIQLVGFWPDVFRIYRILFFRINWLNRYSYLQKNGLSTGRFFVLTVVSLTGYRSPRNVPWRPIGGVEVELYLFPASALGESLWSTPRSGHSTPGKETRYPFYRRLGGPEGRSGPMWWRRNSIPYQESNHGPPSP